jgi:hypothetical protein
MSLSEFVNRVRLSLKKEATAFARLQKNRLSRSRQRFFWSVHTGRQNRYVIPPHRYFAEVLDFGEVFIPR